MAIARPSRGGSALQMYPIKPAILGPKRQYMSIHHATLAPLDPVPSSSDPLDNNNNCININNNLNNSYYGASLSNNTSSTTSNGAINTMMAPPLLQTAAKSNAVSNSVIGVSHEEPLFPSKPLTDQVTPPPRAQKISIMEKKQKEKTTVPFNRIMIGFALNGPNRAQTGTSENPIVDSEVPSVIRLASAIEVASTEIHFSTLPPLTTVNDPKFDFVIQKKLEICSFILDFTNATEQIQEKEIKARTMCELIELFENNREIQRLDKKHQSMIFEMLSKNIFKQDPIFPSKIMQVDIMLSIIEPSWPHLFYCYQILNRFVQVFPDTDLITLEVAKKAISLTQLADTNERMQLVAFLRTFFDTHPKDRIELLRLIRSKLLDLIDGIATPFCAMPLIILLTHMYSRSQPSSYPEFLRTIKVSVLPLVGLACLPLYYQNLRQLLVTVLSGSNMYMAADFLRQIELHWPLTDSLKQVQILQILIAVWDKMDSAAFKPMSSRVFVFLAENVESPHSKVALQALDIWENVQQGSWVEVNSRSAIHAMFEAVTAVIEKGWNKNCVEKASHALTEMCRVNKHSYHKMKTYMKQMKAQRYKPRVPNDTQRGWANIAKTAHENGEKFELNEKLKEFHAKFHNEKKPTLAVSRFIPILEKDKKEKKES